MAIMMRGLELAVDDPARQIRSVTMHFLRVPEAGPVTVRAAVERAGRSLTTVSGRLEQEGKLIGIALAAHSEPWEGPLLDDAPMPAAAPPDDPGAPRASGRAAPPPFVERMVMQHRFGPPPFSSAGSGETGGWIGIRGASRITALALPVLADAWFPAPWPRLPEFAPAPMVDLTIHVRSPLPVEAPLLLGRFTNSYVRDGFFDEDGSLWAPDGTLVAQSRQLGLLLGAKAPGETGQAATTAQGDERGEPIAET